MIRYEHTHSKRFTEQMPMVIKWLDNHGLNGSKSRYSKYISHIDDFYKGNINDMLDLEQRFKKMNKAVQECIEIVLVYEAFREITDRAFWDRMKKVVSGNDFYDGNKPNDFGRDFLYELLIAAWLYKRGFEIDFEQTTDVVAYNENIKIYAECKRIKSNKTFEVNYKKAIKQLDNIKKENNSFKMVFIDVYNCVSQHLRDYEYSNILSIQQEVNSVVENYFESCNKHKIHSILDEKHGEIDAAIFSCRKCFWLSDVIPQYYEDFRIVVSEKATDEEFCNIKQILYGE